MDHPAQASASNAAQPWPVFATERGVVVGIDEAGRGPWAGPVVAGAVVLKEGSVPPDLTDSKALSAAKREALLETLMETAQVGVGVASVEEIDRLNILRATYLAMERAYQGLGISAGLALVDGNRLPDLGCPAQAVVKGDSLCPAISAASIAAKVTRDRMMVALDRTWPGYDWASNKGYGTRAHADAMTRLGITPHHRRSFRPVAALL